MKSRRLLVVAACAAATSAANAADLSDIERQWLGAGMPVLDYARQQRLPIDIVVQPQPQPGLSPLAMAFVDGRCKLVLSMRGNAGADALLRNVAAPLQPAIIEAITAHELGHCWRHANGAWNSLPIGFSEQADADDDADLALLRREMRATRREEGFADLVGLAWTRHRHPQQYTDVLHWLLGQRAESVLPGSHHDTRAWVRLAHDGAAFDRAAGNPFEQARALWQQGLADDD